MTMTCSSTESFDLVGKAGARALVTREQGRTLATLALARIEAGAALRVEIDPAEALSPSFADEFFGILVDRLGRERFASRVRVHCSQETWRVLISKVLSHRGERVSPGEGAH